MPARVPTWGGWRTKRGDVGFHTGMSLFRALPPAGTPISSGDLTRWLRVALAPSSDRARRAAEALEARVTERFGVRSTFLVGSGRTGLSLLLEEMARLRPGRLEVAVPGYTCYSVAAAIVRAGLRVRPLDQDPATLDVSDAALSALSSDHAHERVLAIVAGNLFGLPSNLPGLERFARDRGIFLVDDAAQAMGAKVGGRAVGSFGDAGVFSLDKGKNITSLRGGILLTSREDLAGPLERRIGALPFPPARDRALDVAKLTGYALLQHPVPFSLVRRVLNLGVTVYDPEFPRLRYPERLAPLALALLERLDDLNGTRVQRARSIRERLRQLEGEGGLLFPASPPDAEGVALRLPLLLPDRARRDAALEALDRAGLGASASYPRALEDVEGVQPHLAPGVAPTPGSADIAARILTLPTHAAVTDRDVDRMAALLDLGLAAGMRAGTQAETPAGPPARSTTPPVSCRGSTTGA